MFPAARWKYTELSQAMDVYYQDHDWIRLDPAARNQAHTQIIESEDQRHWRIEQTLIDPAERNDFQILFSLSIDAARAQQAVKIVPLEIRPLLL